MGKMRSVKKERVFWYHYNKPLSKKLGIPMMTFHYAGKCLSVRHIICNVPTRTKERKQQPYKVVRGVGKGFYFVEYPGYPANAYYSVEINKD